MLASVTRNSVMLVGACVVAVLVLRDQTEMFTLPAKQDAARPAAESRPRGEPLPRQRLSGGNQMVLEAGPHGQFYLDARVGYRDITFLVDTGAYAVALSQEDAEAIGYAVHQLDYSLRTSTANGMARAAPILIDEIAVGQMVVRDVPAVVIDSPMKGSLLGMTFLRKLAGYEVRNDRLILRW